MDDWQKILSVAGSILTLVLVGKLFGTRLAPRYRYFTLYLLIGDACSLSLLLVKPHTTLYGAIWLSTRPIGWILSLLVLLEVYGQVMGKYPGIASLMRWTVSAAAVASGALSALSLTLDISNPADPFPILRCAFAVQRTVDATMALSLLIPLLFMLQFPVRLSRNVIVHCILFAVSMGAEAVALFTVNLLGHGATAAANHTVSAISLGCRVCWIALLNWKGERARQAVGPMCSPEMEQELLTRLRTFNAALLKATAVQ